MSKLVHNERVKLGATALSNLGVGSALAGTILPALTNPELPGLTQLFVAFLGWSLWVLFHGMAQFGIGLPKE